VSGEDNIEINQKYIKAWHGTLKGRVLIFSNVLLRLQEASGALAGRFICFEMTQTFWGREDLDLTNKLLAERPGIFNLALDGYDRLRRRGSLFQPTSGAEMADRLERLASEVKAFIDECCIIAPDKSIKVEKLFASWQLYCTRHNIPPGSWGTNNFSEQVRSIVPGLKTSRPRKGNSRGRATLLHGIGLVND
jgi:putative DNA primase/helicase